MRTLLASLIVALATPALAADRVAPGEDYLHVPMPAGFQVVQTELDGPVFAEARGRTIYMWPLKRMRNGYTGEAKGKPACTDEKTTTNAGLMSPYPPGLILPDLETRRSCTQEWPPVLAPADAKPVGSFSIVTRKDGAKQWAYDEHPLYTSVFDHEAGDVLGGTTMRTGGASPAERVAVGPPPNIPPGFAVVTTRSGRMLLNAKHFAVYSYDKDTATKSACTGDCAVTWNPILAPESAQAQGEWSMIERSPGVRQWAFRKKPLYTYALDTQRSSQVGSDEPGWHNVFTQVAPAPPKDFTLQETDTGTVVADRRGMTVYIYGCGDDAQDQLACDHPETTQAFRFAMCGGGDPDVCVRNWPYVLAATGAKSGSRSWGTMWINPKTGHRAKPDEPGALHVWTFRDRPVYTWSGDKQPGDTDGDGRGEFVAHREGFKAFWVRDDFFGAAD